MTDRTGLKAFFKDVRNEINSRFVGFAANKSSYSFIVLLCPHSLFTKCSGIASELRDSTAFHVNTIVGVIVVDSDTRQVTADFARHLDYPGPRHSSVSGKYCNRPSAGL